jgi:hypothetical protein
MALCSAGVASPIGEIFSNGLVSLHAVGPGKVCPILGRCRHIDDMFIFINLQVRNIYIILIILNIAAKPLYCACSKPKADFLRRRKVCEGRCKVLEDDFLVVYKISQSEIVKI